MLLRASASLGLTLILSLLLTACGGGNPNTPISPPAISTSSLPAGDVNVAYSATLSASGGIPPYTWSVISGSLPAGVTLNSSTGAIAGTPTASGTSAFMVQVQDSQARPAMAETSLSVTIYAPLLITTTSLPPGEQGTLYQETLSASGGLAPYSWSIASGSLPPGLDMNSGGVISGTPAGAGTSNFQVQATDTRSKTASAPLTLTIVVTPQGAVTTQHNDNARTGQNRQETILTPANVSSGQFGKLFSVSLDGVVYAQPLYVPNVSIPTTGVHNVIYVVTEHDSVYALDADTSMAPLWQVSFINPAQGITTVSTQDVNCFDGVVPEIGITSTPVIDPATNTLYVVAETKENGSFFHRLHALDLQSGAEKFGGPVTISGSVPGHGSGSVGGILSFDPLMHLSRPGLLLSGSKVFISWASNCDNSPYHGWVMAYDTGSLQQKAIWASTPNGNAGGFWMSGVGMAADGAGNVFVPTGNGTFDSSGSPTDFGDSILRLTLGSSGLSVADYFTPYDEATLDQRDYDLGSGGVLLLPDQPGSHPHELVQAGKEGSIYLVDRDNMGHFNPNDNSQIVQNLTGEIAHLFSAPAYWNNTVYFGAWTDTLKAFSLSNGMLSSSPTSQTSTTFQFPGPSPSISANGNSNGIVWALQTNSTVNGGNEVLRAYDATNLANELYNTLQNPDRDDPGGAVKFAVPTIANGKVYVGAAGLINVYGLMSVQPATGVFLQRVQSP